MIRDLFNGGRLLIRDALRRAEIEKAMGDPRNHVSPFISTPKGPAIGLDGQAFMLGLRGSDWDVNWPAERKRHVLARALEFNRRKGLVA